ncbi:MAG: penicillin-binding protein 1C [Pseudomonadota bacterium]
MTIWTRIAAASVAVIALLWTVDRLFPPPLSSVVTSQEVLDRDGLLLRAFPVENGRWRLKADLQNIDPRFIDALLVIEDDRFYRHQGVDFLAVLRAMRDNIVRGRTVSGASTITMQTARLMEPRPRTLPSKFIEMLRALQLEMRLSKDEILALYLTLTPYGGNLEGVRTAAFAYFGTDANALTDAQIALLIALPQSPEARRPDRQPAEAKRAREIILTRLTAADHVNATRAAEAALDPLPAGRQAFPAHAWHFADRFGSDKPLVHTTIDRGTQTFVKQLLAQTIKETPSVQAATVVIDIESRAIVASVGSGALENAGGWLDLTRRDRSPGSTLKPLVYGLAMQEGLISANTYVADVPAMFGAYAPENFGRTFNGDLTIATALQHSLNVPAVQVLDQVGAERMVGALRAAGVQVALPPRQSDGTGLAIALGGLGLSAEDLALLYAALADGGIAKPLAHTPDEAVDNIKAAGRRILTEQAAADVLAILREGPAPTGRLPAHLSRSAPRIAFKTGTSYGFRDAWAIGVGERYVAVVWTGRPDGAPRPGQTGRAAALPLLFNTFDQLEGGRSVRPPPPPNEGAGPEILTADETPQILFPPDGATLVPHRDGLPFVLAGRARSRAQWYADGRALPADRDGNVLWQPNSAGFYTLSLIDADGRRSDASVRIHTDMR